MPSVRTAAEVLVARQPVYDPSLRVVAYELLADGGGESIAEIGLSLVAGHAAYVPISQELLAEGFARALPSDQVVLAVPGGADLDEAGLEAVRALVADGYRLALMEYSRESAELAPLLPLASVVGLRVSGVDRGALRIALDQLRGRGVTTLARGVEHHEELDLCLTLGFDLLQGHFICRPRVVSDGAIKAVSVNRVRLISELQTVDAVDFDELQEIVARDVALSYNLLRFINSAFFALPRRVESIRDALVLLGTVNVRKWATLMALAEVQDKPRELVVTGLVRARMCELLAGVFEHGDAEGAFTTGLFSVVDALTDRSMVEVLSGLPLSGEIIAALLNYEGVKGRILRAAVAYERGNFGELGDVPPTRTPLAELYAAAVEWATAASGGLPG